MNLTVNLPANQPRAERLYRLVLIFSVVTIFIFIFAYLISSLLMIKRQHSSLFQEKLRAGEITLNHFVNNAVGPLLQNDTLSLNTLLKEAASVDGVIYAAIVDKKKVVRAHTNPVLIGTPFGGVKTDGEQTRDGDTASVNYTLPTGEHVVELSKPVTFMKKNLGSVYVGVSLNTINTEVEKEISSSVRSMVYLGIVMLLILTGAALFLSIPLRRELSAEAVPTPQELELSCQPCQPMARQKSLEVCAPENMDTEQIGLVNPYKEEITRNQVTVLFAGIKGFKAYAEARGPQEVLDDLNEYLSIATTSIVEFGGYVDKFIGDAVIAVFGNSPLQVDHSERAVAAAVAIQDALLAAGSDRNPLLSKVGIGISSGVVLSGHIGSDVKKEFTFIGESFKVAYSLNVMAGPGEIIMSKDVYQSIEQNVSVEPLAPREMAQRTEPWEYFRLIRMIDRKDYGRGIAH
jgi:adenylate cyclase